MFAIPFPVNAKPPPAGFIGSFIGSLTLPGVHDIIYAYSPVNGFAYISNSSSVYVVDPSGTPSNVTTITLAANAVSMAYLPVSNKIFVLQGSKKYQLIDCSNNTVASQVTMTNAPTISPLVCSSYSVDPATDRVYLGCNLELAYVVPSTGACTKSGFSSTTWQTNMGASTGIAFNPTDGYVYAASATANHMMQVIDPATWTTNGGLVHDFGATITNQTSGTPGPGINYSTGHVYLSTQGSAAKLFVFTSSTTVTTITTTANTNFPEYDSDLKQMFNPEQASPSPVSVYDSTDTSILRTTIGGNTLNNMPVFFACVTAKRYIGMTTAALIKIYGR